MTPTLHDFASPRWPLDALSDRVQKGAGPPQHVCSSILCSSEGQFALGTVQSHSLSWLFCPRGALIDSSPHHKVQIWLLCVCFCFQRLSSSHSLLTALILWCARSEPIKMFLSSMRRPGVLHLVVSRRALRGPFAPAVPGLPQPPPRAPGCGPHCTASSVRRFLFYKPGERAPEIPPSGRCCCQPVISFSIYCVSSFDNPCHMWLHFPPFP